MTRNEIIQALKETIEICYLHCQRMQFAKDQLKKIIPLSFNKYSELPANQISYLDQYLFRFTKLQDTMGSRLFPLLLETMAEPIEKMAFIDVLNRLEKLEIIASKNEWLEMRRLRNDATHEYPQTINDRIEGLNLLFNKLETVKTILDNCQQTINNKLNI
jgi:hypothetical protein